MGKRNKINLSKALEDFFKVLLKAQDREQRLKYNRDAIKGTNEFVEKKGLWSDGLRQF